MHYDSVKKADVKRVIKLGDKAWLDYQAEQPRCKGESGILRCEHEASGKVMSHVISPFFFATFGPDFPDLKHVEGDAKTVTDLCRMEREHVKFLQKISAEELLADVKRVLAEHKESNKGKRKKSEQIMYRFKYISNYQSMTAVFNAEWLAAGLQLVPDGKLYLFFIDNRFPMLNIYNDMYGENFVRFMLYGTNDD